MDKGKGRQGRLQAYDAIKRMERPDSITPTQWGGVRDLLWRIARRYPKAYPSVETLAKEMSKSTATMKRYTRLAREAGLLTVWGDAGTKKRGSFSKTNWYHITELLEVRDQNDPIEWGQNDPQRTGDTELSPVQQTPPSVEKTSSSPPTSGSARQRRGRTTVLAGGNLPRREGTGGGTAPSISAYRQAATIEGHSILLGSWPGTSSTSGRDWCQHQPRLREFRPAESVGRDRGIHPLHLPGPGCRSPCTPPTRFVPTSISSSKKSVEAMVQVKAKQSAFMRFTGWWGRSPSRLRTSDLARRSTTKRP